MIRVSLKHIKNCNASCCAIISFFCSFTPRTTYYHSGQHVAVQVPQLLSSSAAWILPHFQPLEALHPITCERPNSLSQLSCWVTYRGENVHQSVTRPFPTVPRCRLSRSFLHRSTDKSKEHVALDHFPSLPALLSPSKCSSQASPNSRC